MPLFVPSYRGCTYDALASFNRGNADYGFNKQTVHRFDSAQLTLAEYESTVETLDMQRLAPVFIKVDVEGYEYNVFSGGRMTLRLHKPILLVENFRCDSRTVKLAEELAYEEYYFDGSSLHQGTPRGERNSVLMTRGMAKIILE